MNHSLNKTLSLLSEHDVTATFFVVGELLEKYPEIAAEIDDRGHEIAFHGYSNRPLWELNSTALHDEIKKFKSVLKKDAGLLLLKNFDEIPIKQIILSTPVGWNPQSEYDGNPWQKHKSKWDPEEFLTRSFNIKGITGIKNMYSEKGEFKFNTPILKPFFYLLKIISQVFTYKKVNIAYEMLCTKNFA
ncbi:MAG: polysaccharide deacetylase family protein [Candidatus Bathyarchaeum sp.]|nr:MAG: polysaccharide deacetylase family protein [Candidatus Bathyarchaeum sp.]